MQDQQTLRRKTSVALLSVASNSILVVLKLVVGVTIGSVSVISEAIHSGVDLLASFIALWAVRASGKDSDEDHPFGHGKYENLSGALEALLIFVAAVWIIYEAIHKLIRPVELEAVDWGVVVMGFSVVANFIVSTMLFRVGRETESLALQADAWHLRTDVYTSLGVMVGLVGIRIGRVLLPGADLHWVDPVAALAVALLIFRAAWELTAESIGGLLDRRLTDVELEAVRQVIREVHSDVRGFHHLRTRQAGPIRFVEFHLLLDRAMPLERVHEITDLLTVRVRERFPSARVLIHPEPCDEAGNPVGRPRLPAA